MKAILSTVALGAAMVLAAAVPGGAQSMGGSMGHSMMMTHCPGGYVLSAVGGSGESGCATPRGGNGVIFVGIKVTGEPPGAVQPSHVHRGKCGSNGPIVIPLTSVRGGTSVTTIPNAKWSTVNRGGYYINVHESAKNLGHIVACGNITPMHGAM
jgi:CHRD domain